MPFLQFLSVDAVLHCDRRLVTGAALFSSSLLQHVDNVLRRSVVEALLRPAIPLTKLGCRQLVPIHH